MVYARLRFAYVHSLQRFPVTTTAVASGFLGFLGDALAQAVERKRQNEKQAAESQLLLDRSRSFAFTVYAMAWGAFGLRPWLTLLSKYFPGTGVQQVITKVAIHQTLWNPFVYLPTFYATNGILRDCTPEEVLEKARREYWDALFYIWKVWLACQLSDHDTDVIWNLYIRASSASGYR
eukprot:TRINITY_DN14663_c0_g1_i1.p1 TRINITY_DN14663_c0_g1~~TRINITY_DN14663_c0_g1_i1.p1  ORF type:complete len:178 (+),score=29.90 TRINITY_DN14663_c0_g1_i1:57-590(+)